jgi:hypothetical protein
MFFSMLIIIGMLAGRAIDNPRDAALLP